MTYIDHNYRKNWTGEEELILLDNYKQGYYWIGKHLGRSVKACKARIRVLKEGSHTIVGK